MKLFGTLIVFSILATGCGASSNFLGLLTPDVHRESFVHEMGAARAAYDRNDLEVAIIHAEKAYEMNPASEDAAILYGYVNLGLAGADPFALAKEMNKDKASSSESSGAPDPAAPPTTKSSSTSDTLAKLQAVIGLEDAEIILLGDMDTSDPELPILIPKCAEEARQLNEKLGRITKAIVAICPFVHEDVPNLTDSRQLCYPRPMKYPDKNHFLWAFAHLTESLAFNSVLQYGIKAGEKSNLEKRVSKLEDQQTESAADLDKFLQSIEAVEATVDAVLPTGSECSPDYPTTQLVATLNDLLAVDAAFDMMPHMPKKITKALKKNIAKIKELESAGEQTKALKADMSKKMSDSLSAKLDTLDEESLTPEKKAAFCDSFESISGGADTKPDLCL